jgi:hypothetical protein
MMVDYNCKLVIEKLFLKLRDECIDRITKEIIGLPEHDINNKIIAIVREMNKKWNKEVEKNPSIKKNGFKKAMKNILLDMNFSTNLNNALKYL